MKTKCLSQDEGMTQTDKKKDLIYREEIIGNFVFDDKVAEVFDDMINRSVPGYQSIIKMIQTLAARYVTVGSNVYDLGCSLGNATVAILKGVKVSPCRIFAIDNSVAMIEKCRQKKFTCDNNIELKFECADMIEYSVENASMVVLNFTIQFVSPQKRSLILKKIYEGMNPGGILILSEKVRFEDDRVDQLLTEIYHGFKKENGYTDLEISRKRAALEQVLIPESINCHIQRLLDAGFKSADVWFQCFNFTSMLAIK